MLSSPRSEEEGERASLWLRLGFNAGSGVGAVGPLAGGGGGGGGGCFRRMRTHAARVVVVGGDGLRGRLLLVLPHRLRTDVLRLGRQQLVEVERRGRRGSLVDLGEWRGGLKTLKVSIHG